MSPSFPEPNVGCYIKDIRTDETRFLADVGLSLTAETNLAVATRLIDFDQFVITSGAPLPIGELGSEAIVEFTNRVSQFLNTGRFDPAQLIRESLRKSGAGQVQYCDPTGTIRNSDALEGVPGYARRTGHRKSIAQRLAVSRSSNERCRCGSGKMQKNCCGKPRIK